MANPSDTTYHLVPEVVEGSAPATPAFKGLDYIPGNEFKLDSKLLSSDVLKQNRAMAGLTKVNVAPTWTLKTHLRSDTSLDTLFQSVMSGTFNTKVLKGGFADSTVTIEKKMVEAGVPDYTRLHGMMATKLGLTVDASSNAEVSFDMLGMSRTTSSAILTGATYAAPVQGPLLSGKDVGSISIGGMTATYVSLDLSVEQNRESKWALGNAGSIGTGTAGPRAIKLVVKAYRNGIAAYANGSSDVAVPITFTLGTGAGNGYTFNIPAAVYSQQVNDETSGSNAFITLEFMGQWDATAATDLVITKL